jgi:hypothetical protein
MRDKHELKMYSKGRKEKEKEREREAKSCD